MQDDQLKLNASGKLVEGSPEPEQAKLPVSAESIKELQPLDSSINCVAALPAPRAVREDKLWLMARFSFICCAIGFIPFMLAPGFLLPAFNHPAVRTAALAVLIWNLSGAALYAGVKTRWQRAFLYVVFGLPLITLVFWWSHALMLFHTIGLLQ